MGTRGAFGFFIHGETKVFYNHYDSYPSGRGVDFAEKISELSPERLTEIARSVIVLPKPRYGEQDCDLSESAALALRESLERFVLDHPGAPRAAELKRSLDSKSASSSRQLLEIAHEAFGGSSSDEFCLDGYPAMIDSSGFLGDSLMCEWAWIVNLDENVLEVYRGFNQNALAAGRYAGQQREGSKYFGVGLAEVIPLPKLRELANDNDALRVAFESLECYCMPENAQERIEIDGDSGTGPWLALRESWAIQNELSAPAPKQETRLKI